MPRGISTSPQGGGDAGCCSPLRVVEDQAFDCLRHTRVEACAKLNDVAIGIAHEDGHMSVSERDRTLRNRGSSRLEPRSRLPDIGDTERNMRIAGVFFWHVHQDVLAARAVHTVADE